MGVRQPAGARASARAAASTPAASPTWTPTSWPAAFSAKPALHRYPGSMAGRVQELAKLSSTATAARPRRSGRAPRRVTSCCQRVKELPGFGEQKAKIFVALLGKQLGVRPDGWETVSAPFGDKRQLPLGGRHHRRRHTRQGARLQAGTEGGQQGGAATAGTADQEAPPRQEDRSQGRDGKNERTHRDVPQERRRQGARRPRTR